MTSFRMIIGWFRLYALREDADNPATSECSMKKDIMSKEIDLKKEVRLITSSGCTIPFTYRVFKPVIVLPRESAAWTKESVNAVLLHELAHIRRCDYLTQTIARLICSFFWFIPFVWIAYDRLHQEQEKACDAYVIEKGINPADYAAHILDLARFSTRTLSFQGSFLSRGRKKVLEGRILHALSFKKAVHELKGGGKMRRRNFLLLCTILLISIALIGSCATRRKAISEEEFFDAYSGTWINTGYSGEDFFTSQKTVQYPDGRWMLYAKVGLDQCRSYGRETITDMWKDTHEVIWYRATRQDNLNTHVSLMGKISDSGNTLEQLFQVYGEPIEEWDPDNERYHYMIHYRQ